MRTKAFNGQLDEAAIVRAIGDAERASTGEVRVFVSNRHSAEPIRDAVVEFDRLGMKQTTARNGVLLFVAPETQSFAIVGDIGIHERCGDAFWKRVVGQAEVEFKAGRPTDAVVAAIRSVGAELARWFPPNPDDRNELPDRIERG